MGASRDVMRSLQSSRVLAARYTNPLTLLPGQVPINEHLERLLARRVAFSAWFIEVDQMRGLNDSGGFTRGRRADPRDARGCSRRRARRAWISPGTWRAVASSCWCKAKTGVRARRALIEKFPTLVEAQVPADAFARGYFTLTQRDGHQSVRPMPRLVIGIVPVLPGVFETRHEVVAVAKRAAEAAMARPGSALHVDEQHANAYPQSLLFESPRD